MTRKQYQQLKQAARFDAACDPGGIGAVRAGHYVVVWSELSGYEICYSPLLRKTDFCRYIHSCAMLARYAPGTSAKQLADCKAFLEAYKK